MGATTFGCVSKGQSARAAFESAREAAQWRHGNEGYTGTVAEKSSFVLIAVPEGMEPLNYADQLLDEGDPRVDDKWGPAGCVRVGEDHYYFFGWASC
jgi:hypothetical protein